MRALYSAARPDKMRTEHEIEKATRIGERNREVIQLLQNWCAHARVVRVGGVGLIEEMTGLPIGMRQVTCEHQQVPGNASMHMQVNALDFHDRNCVSCTVRLPVRLPNLTELVRQREEAVESREVKNALNAEDFRRKIERRAADRAALREVATVESESVLDLVDVFDRNPSGENVSLLLESARAVPAAFGADVVAHLAVIGDAGGPQRTQGVLELLDAVSVDPHLHLRVALRAIARGEAQERAARVVARTLQQVFLQAPIEMSDVDGGALLNPSSTSETADNEWMSLLQDAIPGIVWMAHPIPTLGLGHEGQTAQPAALLAAFNVAPEVVARGVRIALRSAEKAWRRAGAHAVVAVLDARGIDAVRPFVPDLLAGFAQPDDVYGSGEAARVTAWALAELLQHDSSGIDGALVYAGERGGKAERHGVMQTYVAVLEQHDLRTGLFQRRGHTEGRERTPSPVEALAYRRVLDTLARLPDDGEIILAGRGLLDRGAGVPEVLERDAVPTLLGIVALAASALDASMDTSVTARLAVPRHSLLHDLEQRARRSTLAGLSDAAMSAVLRVADGPKPSARDEVVSLMLTTLLSEPTPPVQLRAKLVEHLGQLGSESRAAARVLPAIYRALTDHAQLVRAAAARAYAELVSGLGAESLPSLLHDTFLVLLADPYVIVHSAALRALDDVTLPEGHLPEALQRVEHLVVAYADGANPDVLDRALRVWLELLRRVGHLSDKVRAIAVHLAGKLPAYSAQKYVRYNRSGLRGAAGYADFVIALLANPETFDSVHEDLLDELAELGAAEIARLAESIVTVGMTLLTVYPWHLERLLQILADAGAWESARRLAAHAISACGERRDRRPRKLRSERAEALIELEANAAAGDTKAVIAAARRVRDAEATIAAEAAAHTKEDDIQRILATASLVN